MVDPVAFNTQVLVKLLPAVTEGKGFEVTRTWSVLLQVPEVAVTVYVVVPGVARVTVGFETVLLLRSVVGDQL